MHFSPGLTFKDTWPGPANTTICLSRYWQCDSCWVSESICFNVSRFCFRLLTHCQHRIHTLCHFLYWNIDCWAELVVGMWYPIPIWPHSPEYFQLPGLIWSLKGYLLYLIFTEDLYFVRRIVLWSDNTDNYMQKHWDNIFLINKNLPRHNFVPFEKT